MGNAQLAVSALTEKDTSGDEETKEEGVEDNGTRPSKRQRFLLQLKKKYTSARMIEINYLGDGHPKHKLR